MPRKIQPMELDIWLQMTDGTNYVDIAQCLSLMNRKSLRQGMQYVVQDITLFASDTALTDPATPSTCIIERLPHHWPMANSWVKSLAVWNRSEDQVLETDESIRAKWRDFKVFFDGTHADYSNQALDNLVPLEFQPLTAPVGGAAGIDYDWDMAQIVIPNDANAGGATEEYFIHVLGDNNGTKSKGMIHGYAVSRSRPVSPDPNTPETTGWMVEAFDDGDNLAEIKENVRGQNDEPPYFVNSLHSGETGSGQEFYPGGANLPDAVVVADLAATTYQTQKSTGSFTANLGLLKLTSNDDALMRIRISAGHYKGVMARPMQEVN